MLYSFGSTFLSFTIILLSNFLSISIFDLLFKLIVFWIGFINFDILKELLNFSASVENFDFFLFWFLLFLFFNLVIIEILLSFLSIEFFLVNEFFLLIEFFLLNEFFIAFDSTLSEKFELWINFRVFL